MKQIWMRITKETNSNQYKAWCREEIRCLRHIRPKNFYKYEQKVKELIKEGKKWKEVELIIRKIRFINYKEYMKVVFQAFGKNAKLFHE